MTAWLVVNADDLGVSKGATLGIVKAHREGILTSASMCVTTPYCHHAVEQVRSCPELGIGLHLALTLGSPLSDNTPLLKDRQGRFGWTFSSLFLACSVLARSELLAQVDIEIEAQFARLAQDGITPDHVDSERHVHLIPGIFERVVAAAKRHNVPFVRAGTDRGSRYFAAADLGPLVASGGFVKSALLSNLAARGHALLDGLRSPDHAISYLYTGRIDAILPGVLSRAEEGVTEVMVHPGLPAENGTLELGYREIERYLNSPDRESELKACIDARGHTQGWALTTYRALAGQAA